MDVTHDQWTQAETELPRNQWIFEAPTAWHRSLDAEVPRIHGLGPLLSAEALIAGSLVIFWCCCPDSNGGPTDYESDKHIIP